MFRRTITEKDNQIIQKCTDEGASEQPIKIDNPFQRKFLMRWIWIESKIFSFVCVWDYDSCEIGKVGNIFSRRARRRIDIVVFGRRFLISRKFSLTWVLTSFGRPDRWRMEYSTSYLIFGQPWFSHLTVTLNMALYTGSWPEVATKIFRLEF